MHFDLMLVLQDISVYIRENPWLKRINSYFFIIPFNVKAFFGAYPM